MLPSWGVGWKAALGDKLGTRLLLRCEAVVELEGAGVYVAQRAKRGE